MVRHSSASDPQVGDPIRQRIVLAARLHFLQHGFRGVTMADLATELGMSKKTVYAHFSTKVALVEAVLQDKFSRVEAEMHTITVACATDFSKALQQMLACVQKHTDEIQPSFLRDIQRSSPELFQLVEKRRHDVIQKYFGILFTEGRKRGMIRKDVRVDLVVAMLLAATQAIVNPPALAAFGLTPTTGFASILTVVLEGMLTMKGRFPS